MQTFVIAQATTSWPEVVENIALMIFIIIIIWIVTRD